MAIKFLYFDLGRVLLDFTHEQGFEQIARIANIDTAQVRKVLVEAGLSDRYEVGEITTPEFHEMFCSAIGTRVAIEDLALAWSDIFTLIPGTVRLAASLRAAGYSIGILSNTCEAHWEFAAKRFRVLSQIFDPVITSYDAKSMKPDGRIFEVAAEAAGVAPETLFFVDDRLENVDGAKRLGWTAVQFHSPLNLANDLEHLGLVFNR